MPRRKTLKAESLEEFWALHDNPKESDDFMARVLLDWLWPVALCVPEQVWSIRGHILAKDPGTSGPIGEADDT